DHDLAPVLGRTLRAGLLDELYWPAWEQAAHRITAAPRVKHDNDIDIDHQWPYLLVRRGDLILVVGPDGIELEHLLRIPVDERGRTWSFVFRYVDGQLLVSWTHGSTRRGYWSGSPDDIFDTATDAFNRTVLPSLPVPGGGRTSGGRPLRVGDRAEQSRDAVAGDGRTYWVVDGDERRWTEFDPMTGQRGRASLPAFIEDGAVDGEPLQLDWCRLWPVPIADGALGVADGLVGWRVRRSVDGRFVGEGIDGRQVSIGGEIAPYGAVQFPGADRPVVITVRHSYRSATITLSTGDGFGLGQFQPGETLPDFARGTPLVPPVMGWHFLRPRDLHGSAALRGFTDAQATGLLSAAAGHRTKTLRELVPTWLPQVSDPALLDGVTGVVRQAAKLTERLAELTEQLRGAQVAAPGQAPSTTDAGPADPLLNDALESPIGYCYSKRCTALPWLYRVATALTATAVPTTAIDRGAADNSWTNAFGLVSLAMVRAAAPLTTQEHRDALIALLDLVAVSGLTTVGSRLRRLELQGKAVEKYRCGQAWQVDSRRLLVVDCDKKKLTVLEYSPDGATGPVPDFTISAERVLLDGAPTPEQLEAFLDKLRADGPPPARPELADELSRSAGMTHAEALMLLAGLPDQHEWNAADPAARQAAGLDHPGVATARVTWGRQNRPSWDRSAREWTVWALQLLLPDDPLTLWTRGPAIERVAASWVERNGVRTPVSDELVTLLQRGSVAVGMSASELAHGIANPGTCRWLAGACDWVGDEAVVRSVARALPWLVYHLPAGDPLRSALPDVVARVRDRLADPGLSISFGYLERAKLDDLAAALGVAPVVTDDETVVGPFVLQGGGDWPRVRLRPALLSGWDDPALPAARTLGAGASVAAVRLLLDGTIAATVAVGPQLPDGAQGALQDPSRSRPELVAEAAGKLSISADAATVYLQLLALPDPTDRNVARWTGWKPARLKAARAELAGTDLVVEAKRPRAGRSLFLPGGWLALASPHLPLELWKKPMMLLDDDGEWLLGVIVPAVAVPELFEQAWTRVADGDGPRFEELVTGRRR
ncbi:MAG TPA: hypothetical protein VFO77_04440, partial [Actinoplanes sp.]|nr:hypothetical protein [Actinoplanes sp.]